MNNEKLIEYLRTCLEELEPSFEYESGESTELAYLYFAKAEECFPIYKAEKSMNYSSWHSFSITQTQKNQNDILALRPNFDTALEKQKITSITTYSFPITLENASENSQRNFINEIAAVEKSRGVLNALLTLRKKLGVFSSGK